MIVYATLAPNSPRRDDWLHVFGTDRIRLESAKSELVLLPGLDGPRRCYRFYFQEWTIRNEDAAASLLAARFFGDDLARGQELVVDAFGGRHGLPILDGPDLFVTVEAEFYL